MTCQAAVAAARARELVFCMDEPRMWLLLGLVAVIVFIFRIVEYGKFE